MEYSITSMSQLRALTLYTDLQLTFQEVVQAAISWDFKLGPNAQGSSAGFGNDDGLHDPLVVALQQSSAEYHRGSERPPYREVQRPLIQRTASSVRGERRRGCSRTDHLHCVSLGLLNPPDLNQLTLLLLPSAC